MFGSASGTSFQNSVLVLTQDSHRQPAQGHAHGHASLLVVGVHAGQHAET